MKKLMPWGFLALFVIAIYLQLQFHWVDAALRYVLISLPASVLHISSPASGATLTKDETDALSSARQGVLWVAGGLIAIITIVLTWRRDETARKTLKHEMQRERTRANEFTRIQLAQSTAEQARRKEHEERQLMAERQELRSRHTATIDLFSSAQPLQRIAAFHLLADIVDDWLQISDRAAAQDCIELYCHHLRPLLDLDESSPLAVSRVAEYAMDILRSRLQREAITSWCGMRFDFRRAIISRPIQLNNINLTEKTLIDFQQAVFKDVGQLNLHNATITDDSWVSFNFCTFTERSAIRGNGIELAGNSSVILSLATFADNSHASFNSPTLVGNSVLNLTHTSFTDKSRLTLSGASLKESSSVLLSYADQSDLGTISVSRVAITEQAWLDMSGIEEIDSNRVKFRGIKLEGGHVATDLGDLRNQVDLEAHLARIVEPESLI